MASISLSRLSPQQRAWIPNLVLLTSVLLTVASTYYVAAEAEAKDGIRFESAVGKIQDSIRRRLEIYEALLRGGRGLFIGSEAIDRDEFRRFVGSLHIETFYPGIQGIGYAARVDAATRDQIVEAARADGISDFRIWPDGEGAYTTILYLEPQDMRNRAALGFDMYSEPVRRAAMERARDSGRTTFSGRVSLVQELGDPEKQAGFLIYTPVYRSGAPTSTVEERRASLTGFVYSPFRVNDLLSGVFGAAEAPDVHLGLYDTEAISPETLLFDSRRGAPGAADHVARFSAVTPIELEGRNWSLVVTSTPEFERASGRGFAVYAFVTGLLVSMLLFAISRLQVNAWASADRIAAELRRSEIALRESESRLRRLVESNIVGIMIADIEGRIHDANDAFLAIVGYSRDELEAGSISLEAITPGDQRPFDAATLGELRATGARAPFESSIRKRDGVTVPVLEGLALLEGSRELVVGFVLDQTERARAEEERAELLERERRAREVAEQASRIKDEFLATVSHELRTPLNAILGWARLLRAGALDEARIAVALETIERNAKAQARLIEDLLDVSRIVSGKLRLLVAPVDLLGVVDAALEAVEPAATSKGVRVRSELDASTGAVSGDATRLQQVVWNLLSNAVKFTPSGGEVLVRLSAVDSDARIEVSDTGEGMAPEFLRHAFEPFRQEDSSISRHHGGLGLGLAIVRNLVEMHGGTVHAESAGENAGSTFTIRLPLVGLHIDAADASGEEEAPSLSGRRVLVVDDDRDAQEVFAAMLESVGATVMTCGSMQAALDALEAWRPDVLLSDIAMPGGSGYDLLRAIRESDSEVAHLPAIALSAYARPEDRRESLGSGFQDHLGKPVDTEQLVEAISRALTTRRDRQAPVRETDEAPGG
jgi:PAS domain S-box-containing protein